MDCERTYTECISTNNEWLEPLAVFLLSKKMRVKKTEALLLRGVPESKREDGNTEAGTSAGNVFSPTPECHGSFISAWGSD